MATSYVVLGCLASVSDDRRVLAAEDARQLLVRP
jgi:hypothetical protein